MKTISASHTKQQVINRTKTVTRRLGWKTLKPGTRLRVVEKAMGLKKGERQTKLAEVEVVSVRREPLGAMNDRDYGRTECIKEGFPDWSGAQFVEFFTKAFKCDADQIVTRIEWRYL